MLRERLRHLFSRFDPPIRQIVNEVGELEKMHLSMERPRVKDQIDEIITRVAQQELAKRDGREEPS